MTETPICMITDETYLLPTMVAVLSMRLNARPGTHYDITVLTIGEIPEKYRAVLEALDCRLLEPPMEAQYASVSMGNRHVSQAALYKFDLGRIFSDHDRLLYIDADVIVQHDLTPLLNADIAGTYAGVVESFSAVRIVPDLLERLGVKHYFNSGVMLLNLKRMREERLDRRLIDYRLHGWNHFMDQDALNAVFHDDITCLSPLCNLQCTSTYRFTAQQMCELYGMVPAHSWHRLYREAVVIHYASAQKPWLFDNTWQNRLWIYYCRRLSALYGMALPERTGHPAPNRTKGEAERENSRILLPVKHMLLNPRWMLRGNQRKKRLE